MTADQRANLRCLKAACMIGIDFTTDGSTESSNHRGDQCIYIDGSGHAMGSETTMSVYHQEVVSTYIPGWYRRPPHQNAAVWLARSRNDAVVCAGGQASSEHGDTPDKAFDDNDDTIWDGRCSNCPNQYIEYTLSEPARLASYTMTCADGERPTDWRLEAKSSAAASWTLVDERTSQTLQDRVASSYTLVQVVEARIWRWTFSGGAGGNSNGYPFEFFCSSSFCSFFSF